MVVVTDVAQLDIHSSVTVFRVDWGRQMGERWGSPRYWSCFSCVRRGITDPPCDGLSMGA